MRAISHLLLTAMLLATFFCGGCVACPQFFMVPGAKKDCCQDGQCRRSQTHAPLHGKQCNRMAFGVNGFTVFEIALPAIAAIAPEMLAQPAPGGVPEKTAPANQHAPPDLNILHRTILV